MTRLLREYHKSPMLLSDASHRNPWHECSQIATMERPAQHLRKQEMKKPFELDGGTDLGMMDLRHWRFRMVKRVRNNSRPVR